MEFKFIKENDILIIILAHGKIDHVERVGPINIHFSIDKRPIIIEILNATNFLKKALNFTKNTEDYKRLKS